MAAAAVPDAPVVCPGHTRPISEICFSDVTPEGVFFIAGSVDQKPMLREGRTGDWIGTFDGHTGAVWSAKMNKAATHCVTGSADFSIRLWDAIKGVQSAAFAGGHVVKAVTFSHDEKTIVAGGYSKQLMVFSVSRPGAPVLTVPHPTRIRKLAALPSGFVATGDEEGTLRMFTLEAGGKQLDELRMDGIIGEVHDLTVVKPTDGGPLTSGGLIACVGRWVLLLRVSEEGKLAVAHKLRTPFLARVDSASIHQDGLHLVLGGGDAASAATTKGGVASLYVFLVKLINPAAAAGAAGSPAKGSYAATATSAGAPPAAAAEAAASVKRRAFVGCELLSISKGHVGPIRCLRFSPDGERFASGGEDGNIRLWSFAAQLRAGSGGADDLPAVNDKGTPLDSGAAGAAERKAAAVKSSGAYRPGAFGRAKRQ